jgi:DNA polymerase-4
MAAYGAKLAAKNALNGDSLRYDNSAMPAIVFTDPQVASVGLTESAARAAGSPVPSTRKSAFHSRQTSAMLPTRLPLGLQDEPRRPSSKLGMARWAADCAVDKIRDRFGWDAIGYGSAALGISRSVPDEFRKLAEKDL